MISICIPTYNRLPDLQRCLDSIFKGFKKANYSYEVIIADGGSTDGTLEYLRSLDSVKLIEQGKLVGAVKAVNECCKKANGDYVFTANDDFKIFPEVLIDCCNLMDEEENIGLVAPKIQEPRFGNLPGVTVKKYWILLAKICIFRHSILKKINYFDERYRTYYVDDDNFLSVMKLGYTTIFSKKIGIIHYRVRDEKINIARAENVDSEKVKKDRYYLLEKWKPLEDSIEKYLKNKKWENKKSKIFQCICNNIWESRILNNLTPKWLYDRFLQNVVIFKDEKYNHMKDFYLAQKYPDEILKKISYTTTD